MGMRSRWQDVTAKLRAPQYLAAVFVVGVGVMFHLSRLAEILLQPSCLSTPEAWQGGADWEAWIRRRPISTEPDWH